MVAKSPAQISFSILEREYRLACDEDEVEDLTRAVELLKEKMREMRQQGNVIGGERIAVMTAIHLAHELYIYKQDKEGYTDYVESHMRNMRKKVATALKEFSRPAHPPASVEAPTMPSSTEPVGVTRETE